MFIGLKNKDCDLVISYGDIIFKDLCFILLSNQNEIVIVVDKDYSKKEKSRLC